MGKIAIQAISVTTLRRGIGFGPQFARHREMISSQTKYVSLSLGRPTARVRDFVGFSRVIGRERSCPSQANEEQSNATNQKLRAF